MRVYSLVVLLVFPGMMHSCTVTMPETLLEIAGKSASFNLNSRAIEMREGFQDTLIIGDEAPPDFHGAFMVKLITAVGVPEKNTRFFDRFGFYSITAGNGGLRRLVSGDFESLRLKTRVVHMPYAIPFASEKDPPRIVTLDSILFVHAAGNMRDYYQGDRDLWRAEHVRWDPKRWSPGPQVWRNVQGAMNTGKVIRATHATRVSDTEVIPDTTVVACGDPKEHCFAVTGRLNRNWHTSGASALLSAKSFYLAQFYDTPEEIIEVLRECAIDVGEPGIDREYGNGIVNLICPRILQQEIEVVSEYLKESGGERPEKMKGGDLTGVWEAKNHSLEVYIPQVLEEVIHPAQDGKVNGRIEFKENSVTADFRVEANVQAMFFSVIRVRAEEEIQTEGRYMVTMDTLRIQPDTDTPLVYTYTVTADSLHLVKSLSLKESLSLLPDPLGSMASVSSLHFLDIDPLQIKVSFARVTTPSVPKNLREVEVTENTITLQWDKLETTGEAAVSAYRITKYTDAACTTVSEVKETSEQKIQFTDLTANTEYYFSIEAQNSVGWSAKSDCLTVRTQTIPGDFDGNNVIDFADFLLFVTTFGATTGDQAFNEDMDLVPDGMINFADFLIFIEKFGKMSNS